MLKRLIPSLRKHLALLTWPDGRGIVRRDGILYLVNLQNGSWYDKAILQGQIGEPEQRALFIDNVRRRACDVFLDIGANFGTYAAIVARKTTCPTIVAYEPDERSFDRLRMHLFINGLTERVQTRMVAISDKTGRVPFMRAPEKNDFVSKIGDDGSAFSVAAVRLDDELNCVGRRIALKIDVEGHELSALQGMRTPLESNDCFLQVECWPENAARVIAEMRAQGYARFHRIDDDHYFTRAR